MKLTLDYLAYFDTETTGTDKEDRLVQIAYRYPAASEDVNAYFKAPLPIKYLAMAVHHITQKMVDDRPAFIDDSVSSRIATLAEQGVVFVAHNAQFDVKMLAKEGIEIPTYICTLKVIKYLDVDLKCECYQQQYLRYLAGIEVEAHAHDAWGDILVLEQLFIRFLKTLMKREKLSCEDAIDKMISITLEPSEIKVFTFGKHKGVKIADIAQSDNGYLKWLYKEKSGEEEPDEDWIYTLEKYV